MAAYTSNDDSQLPVTLRISETRLFVSAQNEDEPVLLKVSCSQSTGQPPAPQQGA